MSEGVSEDRLESWKQLRASGDGIMAYAYGLLDHGADLANFATGGDTSVIYHSHCQQRI